MVQALETDLGAKVSEMPQEQKDSDLVAQLAGKLGRTKFRNWISAFQLDESKQYVYHVGPRTRKKLEKFKSKLVDHKRNLGSNTSHNIEVASHAKRAYVKKVYSIDGVWVAFINPKVNEEMEWLLQGGNMHIATGDNSARDIRQDVVFLNEYFGFSLRVRQKDLRDKSVIISLQNIAGIAFGAQGVSSLTQQIA